ncbi:rod shape-determining protein MreD [Roseovarius pelagicus]|uniref:Rod shape-determining protein MreD n=1 Tax=Roseovarius pelagicus TaxID=2980108 RepID=A0ABY6DFV7_9RHOB|nr:rod shape-determining protein MreD [Roseovarius pelagicus]UXX84998.1 rod shape-determining protein MreD [Roseovarius pelagicus]
MAELTQARLWSMRALFAALCLTVIFWRLLPINFLPRGWAGPDLILTLGCAWVLRRPEYAPAFLIAVMVLLADFLFQRPPGLWAALALMGTETLKSRAPGLRDMGFGPEWLTVSIILVMLTLAERLTLAILLVDQAPLGLSLMQLIGTILAYPLVVLASSLLLGVRKIKPGELDSMRQRA